MREKKILIINGSPRKKGTSMSFSRTIERLAAEYQCSCEIIHAIDIYDRKLEWNTVVERIGHSCVIGLITPLYSDTLPFIDVWLLEKLADSCSNELMNKGFFALGQCGFPDITRIEPLLDSCRHFAEDTGLHWLGGLAFGGGPMINGAHLESLGKRGERIISALRMALDAVIQDEPIPAKAQETIELKIPKLLFRPMAVLLNSHVRKQARAHDNADYARKVYLNTNIE